MKKEITVIYVTARKQPKFEWFCESLHREYDEDITSQVIFVDLYLDYDLNRKNYLKCIVNNRFEYTKLWPFTCLMSDTNNLN
jgi:hypothetical protein